MPEPIPKDRMCGCWLVLLLPLSDVQTRSRPGDHPKVDSQAPLGSFQGKLAWLSKMLTLEHPSFQRNLPSHCTQAFKKTLEYFHCKSSPRH